MIAQKGSRYGVMRLLQEKGLENVRSKALRA